MSPLALLSVWLMAAPLLATPARNTAPYVTFSGHSETLLRFYQQQESDRIKHLLGVVELLSIASTLPRLPNLSFHLNGWGQLSLLDETQAIGDLSAAYVSYRDPKLRVWGVLGRQYLYQNEKTLHLDGGRFEARLPLGFGLRLFGGWAVQPQFAPSSGHFVAGARLSHRIGQVSEIGVTFLEMLEEGRPGHELIGLDAMLTPFSWLEISTNLSVDLHLLLPRQLGGRVGLTPLPWLRLALGYDYTTPSAFVSKNSIFSVFSSNAYHEGYIQLSFSFWRRRLALGADLRWIHLMDIDTSPEDLPTTQSVLPSGEQGRIFVHFQFLREPSGWIGLRLERVREQEDGHLAGRFFWQQELGAFLWVLDIQYMLFSRPLGGFPHSFFSSLSGRWRFAPGWDLAASLQFTLSPFVQQAWTGMLKLSYRFFVALPLSSGAAAAQPSARVGGTR